MQQSGQAEQKQWGCIAGQSTTLANATCTFLRHSIGWLNSQSYNSTEVECTYGPAASMQLVVNVALPALQLVQGMATATYISSSASVEFTGATSGAFLCHCAPSPPPPPPPGGPARAPASPPLGDPSPALAPAWTRVPQRLVPGTSQ